MAIYLDRRKNIVQVLSIGTINQWDNIYQITLNVQQTNNTNRNDYLKC